MRYTLGAIRLVGSFGMAALLLSASAHRARAEGDVSKCDSALRSDTYTRTTNDYWTAYAASLITKNDWDKENKDAEGHGVIYGVPVGASYKDYHDHAMSNLSKYNYESAYSNQTDVLRTVLSTNATAAYATCLASQFQGMAAWVSDVGAGSVTITFNFVAARDDRTARKFLIDATGGKISDIDRTFFSDSKVGAIPDYPVVIAHTPNEEVVFQVLNTNTNEKVVVRVPLRPLITYTDWDQPTDTQHQHGFLVPAQAGKGRDGHFCVTPDNGGELIPGTFAATNFVYTGSFDTRTDPEPDPIPAFAPTRTRICYYASITAQAGVFARLDFEYWAQEHKKVTFTVPELADWLPRLTGAAAAAH